MVSLLKTSNSSPSLFFAFLGVCILAGCATPYKSLRLDQMQMIDAPYKFVEKDVQIWWRTNVFQETRNREYVKMESKAGACLAVVAVRNRDLQQMILPLDLVFENEDGDTITPLSLEQALEALIMPLSFKEPIIDVGLWRLGRTANDVIKVKSRIDFVNEMYEWYLVDHPVQSGHLQTGLIVLPVPASTLWTIRLRERD